MVGGPTRNNEVAVVVADSLANLAAASRRCKGATKVASLSRVRHRFLSIGLSLVRIVHAMALLYENVYRSKSDVGVTEAPLSVARYYRAALAQCASLRRS
jgi:hypothetical protein